MSASVLFTRPNVFHSRWLACAVVNYSSFRPKQSLFNGTNSRTLWNGKNFDIWKNNTRNWLSLTCSQLRAKYSECSEVHSTQDFDSSMIKFALPPLVRPNGTVEGSFLIEMITDLATVAVKKHCNQKQFEGIFDSSLVSLKSIDEIKFIKPMKMFDSVSVRPKGKVVAASDRLLTIEILVEKKLPWSPESHGTLYLARLSFETDSNSLTNDAATRKDEVNYQVKRDSFGSDVTYYKEWAQPENSSILIIQPSTTKEFLINRMEEQGTIVASQLTRHDVVTVHMNNITFHEKLQPGSWSILSSRIESIADDIVTVFLAINSFIETESGIKKYLTADGFISYAAINSKKEMVSIKVNQVLEECGQPGVSVPNSKATVVNSDTVRNFVQDFKKSKSITF